MGRVQTDDEKFSNLFDELREYWDEKPLSPISEDFMAELSLPKNTVTRICLFVIRREQIPFYRNYVFPIFIAEGFEPLTFSDVFSPGDNFLSKISSLIERSSLIIIDATSPKEFFMQELEYAKFNKKTPVVNY